MPQNRKKIIITDRFSSEALITLSQQPFLEVIKKPVPSDEDLAQAHAFIIRSRTTVDENFFKKSKNLQVIVTATSGFDHIDLVAAKKWGVTVMHTPLANVESAAQLTWALVLSSVHKLKKSGQIVKTEKWNRDEVLGTELAHKTYGIVGLGRIGSRVAQIAQAFKMKVAAYDPYADEINFTQNNVQRLSYEELLKTADVISFHVPKTKETHNMLNRANLEGLSRGAVLVNTSRGAVINEEDLCHAIEQGWVSAAGLDVFEKEPLPMTSNLLKHPEITLSPHIGANTAEAFAKASEQAALKIIQFFIDGSTTDTLPPKAAWHQ